MIEEVTKLLQAWFDEERGNRVTSNNMQTLVMKIAHALEQEKKNDKED